MNENISAFPLALEGLKMQNGMSLRDYFASKAMQIAGSNIPDVNNYCEVDRNNNIPEKHAHRIAIFSYMVADAMLEARKTTC